MQRLDLLLINPGNKKHVYAGLEGSFAAIEPPLWTAIMASFIRDKEFTVKIIDAEAEGLTPEETADRAKGYNPLLIGIGAVGANPSASSTPKMPAVRSVLCAIKEKGIPAKTVLYGIHPSALPERTIKEEKADFVLRGEGFYGMYQLLNLLRNNADNFSGIKGLWYLNGAEVVDGGWSETVKDLDTLPMAAWDMLPMDRYRAHNWHCFGNLNQRSPYAVIYTSLGCPFNCSYCNIRTLYDGKPGIRLRSINKVIEEIDLLATKYKVKNIKVLDELFALKEDRVTEFCELLIKRNYGLNIWAYARVDTINEKMCVKMKEAGINWLAFGIESADMKVREDVSKGLFNVATIKKAVSMAHNAGIYVVGNFLFGLPEDNLESMQNTLELAEELNCEYSNFYTAMAYPGSRLYEISKEQGVRLPEDWLGYSQFSRQTTPLPSKYLSSEEILRFRDEAFYSYHSSPAYLNGIKDKFGPDTVKHIQDMLKYKIHREILEEKKGAER